MIKSKKMKIEKYIYDVPNFPQEGIVFKDITPLLNNAKAFHYVVNQMASFVKSVKATVIVAPEARGFIFGAAVAYKAGLRFVPIRKPGKLPRKFKTKKYNLEYGSGSLEMHEDSLYPNDRVVIIDDVLATGGTLIAIDQLVEEAGTKVVGISVLIDLPTLHQPDLFNGKKLQTLIKY